MLCEMGGGGGGGGLNVFAKKSIDSGQPAQIAQAELSRSFFFLIFRKYSACKRDNVYHNKLIV